MRKKETEPVYRKVLAININRFLALRRLKKKDLAENAGLSVSFVSDVTAGKGNPSLETIAAIANALEVPLVALLEPPPIGTDGWDASLADTLSKEDKKLGLPPGYNRVSAIVTDHQAFQIAQWHKAAHAKLRRS